MILYVSFKTAFTENIRALPALKKVAGRFGQKANSQWLSIWCICWLSSETSVSSLQQCLSFFHRAHKVVLTIPYSRASFSTIPTNTHLFTALLSPFELLWHKDLSLGGLNNQHLFLTTVEAGNPTSSYWQMQCLMRTCFLLHKWLSLTFPQGSGGSVGSLL